MSNRAITWAYEFDLQSGPKFVLVCLADHADEKNSCYPGQERLAEMTGMSRASIGRHLKQLEDYGLISRTRRSRSDGSGRSSDRYVLNLSFNAADFNVANFNVAEFNVESETVQCRNLSISMSHSATGTLREPSEEPSDKAEPPKGDSGKALNRFIKEVTDAAYEAIGKAAKYQALRQVVGWAIKNRTGNKDWIVHAVASVYQSNKPITQTTLGQFLDGHFGGSYNRATQRQQEQGDIIARLEAYEDSQQRSIG